MIGRAAASKNREVKVDLTTHTLQTIDYSHHEIHGGSSFFVTYSIASLGAMTTPTDMMTLTFTTPDTTKWSHFQFDAQGSAGWRLRFIEGSTGGGATPTGSFTILNKNRNSSTTSTIFDIAGTPVVNKVSYDATLLTGGLTLWDEYLGGSGGPHGGSSGSGTRDELILKQNETYQLSLYGTDTDPAILHMHWYEHTNKI